MTPAEQAEDGKADFGDIYSAPDPRPYFRRLAPLDYEIPQHAVDVLERLLTISRRPDGRERTVLDVCCSYGVNAAVQRVGSIDEVTQRYADPARDAWTSAEVAADDVGFYGDLGPARMLGLDVSQAAIRYAIDARLLADGWAEDLESDEPSAALGAGIADVGLVLCSGGVGYIGPATFGRILASVEEPHDLWLVVFVLRIFDYDPIASVLAEHGLVTEKLPGTFRQRRFTDAAEQDAAVREVRRRGLDPAGVEDSGWLHAECFVTRPANH